MLLVIKVINKIPNKGSVHGVHCLICLPYVIPGILLGIRSSRLAGYREHTYIRMSSFNIYIQFTAQYFYMMAKKHKIDKKCYDKV